MTLTDLIQGVNAAGVSKAISVSCRLLSFLHVVAPEETSEVFEDILPGALRFSRHSLVSNV